MSLLQMSFSGAVLIIVIAAIRAMTVNRLPKKTFLILWGIVLIRLLIPYSVPSAFSVYTLVGSKAPVSGNAVNTVNIENTENTMENVSVHTPVNGILHVIEGTPYEQTGVLLQQSVKLASPVSIGLIIWLTGMILCAVFFTSSYLYWRFAFQTSLPIQNDFVEQWRKKHLKMPPVLVRQSSRISAPLSYGMFQSVILLPQKTDWSNTEQLEYILLHEYVHICRHDSAVKLISTLALCVHWFNPLVWVMYALIQRDIELACDESVVRRFGETSKTTYANMLIDMEARKSGLMPLCNNFSKNAIEERIIAIMKMKKISVITVALSVILIVGITAAFATSASAEKAEKKDSAAQNMTQEQELREYSNGTEEDYRSLLALKTPDYQKMSVADFNMTLLDWANENYERMERIGIDTAYHDIAVDLTDEELSFVTVSVMFSGMENGAYVRSDYTGKPEVDPSYGQYLPQKIKEHDGQSAWCDLYYQFSYHIADKKTITVAERDRSVSGMMEGIVEFWDETSLEALMDMTEEDIVKVLDKIAAENSNDKITIAISKDQISFDCMNELDSEEEGYKVGVVNTDALRIREEASNSASVSSLLPQMQRVIILSEEKGFYHVFMPGEDGLDGWVRKEYVDIDGWVKKEDAGIN